MEKNAWVYMMANKPRGVIYIGATVDHWKRSHEHRTKMLDGFIKKYNLTRLVWFEGHESVEHAFATEKKLKSLSRNKKNRNN